MKKIRTQLLTTAAVVSLSGAAYAADMGIPMKAPPPAPIPFANWQGFYVGGLVGVGRLNETQSETAPNGGKITGLNSTCGESPYQASCAIGTTGVVGGVEVGYDWQSRYFVYGVVADWMATDLSHTNTSVSGVSVFSHTAKVDWLASFRGRMGLAVDDTLVYITGGLALGHLKSGGSASDAGCTPCTNVQLDTIKTGWVAGLGVEHKFTPNWSGKAEFLYYDLGRTSQTFSSTDPTTATYSSSFTHEIFVGRVGVAYHF